VQPPFIVREIDPQQEQSCTANNEINSRWTFFMNKIIMTIKFGFLSFTFKTLFLKQ